MRVLSRTFRPDLLIFSGFFASRLSLGGRLQCIARRENALVRNACSELGHHFRLGFDVSYPLPVEAEEAWGGKDPRRTQRSPNRDR